MHWDEEEDNDEDDEKTQLAIRGRPNCARSLENRSRNVRLYAPEQRLSSMDFLSKGKVTPLSLFLPPLKKKSQETKILQDIVMS